MKRNSNFASRLLPAAALLATDISTTHQSVAPPHVPAFSVDYMDRSVDPATDFYHFADGMWLKSNPVPPDKSRWAAFTELAERTGI